MKKIHCLILVSIFAMTSCSGQEKKTEKQTAAISETLEPQDFQVKLKTTANAVVIDVRTPEEVSQGMIAGAINIDFNGTDFHQKISELDKNKTYFVYCAKGGRSSKAVGMMEDMGFKKLENLGGGFTAWQAKGLPVEKK